MFLRIFSAGLFALALTSCGAEAGAPEGTNIDCAIGAGADYSSVCTLERVGEGQEFLIHHPDGGFRRIAVDQKSGRVISLDGAEKVTGHPASNLGDEHFSIGPDGYVISRYLLGIQE